MATILIIEDEDNLRFTITRTLSKAGHHTQEASRLQEARNALENTHFDLVLTDLLLDRESALDLIGELRASGYDGVVVAMTAMTSVETAVKAMKLGADDYLQKPVVLEELTLQVPRWLEQRSIARRLLLYERLEKSREQPNEILGSSPIWQQTLALARRVAEVPLPPSSHSAPRPLPCTLLLGETGSGKGVVARFIHAHADRAASLTAAPDRSPPPFVHVNCSAIPSNLVEAELFGHERGAFTDAREARLGLFEMADGGTIFLDEISEMPLDLQAKLLLVVEEGVFRRVGGSQQRRVRARVIAASNQNLAERAEQGRFRRDLFYRLNAFTIVMPALRDRGGDASEIACAIIGPIAASLGRHADTRLSDLSLEAIQRHHWPGNVRELVNAVQRAVLLADTARIEPEHLGLPDPEPVASDDHRHDAAEAPASGSLTFDFVGGIHTAVDVERELIMQALLFTRGNVSRAAKLIAMQRSSMRYRIERYGLGNYVNEVAKK